MGWFSAPTPRHSEDVAGGRVFAPRRVRRRAGPAGAPDRRPARAADPEEGDSQGMTDPEQTPEVEQRLAQSLDPERHGKPSEGVPQELPDDDGEDAAAT